MHSLLAGRRAAWGGLLLLTSCLTVGFGAGCGGAKSQNPPGGPVGGEAGVGGEEGGVNVPPDGGSGFFTELQASSIDKVDLLFMIDNSASMGDKQAYLETAIPDLLARLVTPNCLDDANPGVTEGPSTIGASGVAACPGGQHLEFPAVHDMHVGIVSSSLGTRLGDQVGN
ncbi:MAG TPA: hypothetical protein VGI39_16735, partial [Polyangiaceae bacterium]